MTDLIGATPVPGPMHIIGISGLVGNRMNPFLTPICSLPPAYI